VQIRCPGQVRVDAWRFAQGLLAAASVASIRTIVRRQDAAPARLCGGTCARHRPAATAPYGSIRNLAAREGEFHAARRIFVPISRGGRGNLCPTTGKMKKNVAFLLGCLPTIGSSADC
jgi:hypothetical protein